jgi:hypothetical protein
MKAVGGTGALALALLACTNDYDGLLASDPASTGASAASSLAATGGSSSAAGDPAAGSGAGAVASTVGAGGAGGAASGAGAGATTGAGGVGGAASGAGGVGGDGGNGPLVCTGAGEVEGFTPGSCYQYVDVEIGWGFARVACAAWGGDLVVIEGQDEWLYIVDKEEIGDDFWVGLRSNLLTLWSYQWVDGSYPNEAVWPLPWKNDMPGDQLGEPHVKIHGDLEAKESAHLAPHGYLCEKGP